MAYRFLVIIEYAEGNYSAYAPDLPGCAAVGNTIEETEQKMRGAMLMHIQGMLEDNEPIPISHSIIRSIEISLPDLAV